jgi:antitoxin YefM
VLISLDDFNSYVETDYLLSSPKNAARLGKAVRDLKAGRGRQHKLIR